MVTAGRPDALGFVLSVGGVRLAGFALGAAALLFALAQLQIAAVNGLWIDEYFSIWASDPNTPLPTLLGERILPDTNPPIYFTLLALIRPLFDEPRAAFLALNIIFLAVTIAYAFLIGRRAKLPATALLAGALFLISGPVLCYAPEGRVYLMGLCSVFAVAWTGIVAIERGAGPRTLALFAILGVLAALSHVFAALFAGAFAAGLLLESFLRKRTDLFRASLALGLPTTLVFGIWVIQALPHMGNIVWIEFTLASVRDAVWYVKQLAFGHILVAAAFLGFLAWSMRRPEMQPHLRVFAVAGALFVLLPLIASKFTPIITGRYWMLGAAALLPLAALALRAELTRLNDPATAASRPQLASAFGALAIVAASFLGFLNAHAFTAAKPIWSSAPTVQALIEDCAPGSVRVWEELPALYGAAANAPTETFLRADRPETPPLDAAATACPVLGWAEHVRRGDNFMQSASDAELLDMLNIENTDASVVIERHNSGFVVLRGDTPRLTSQDGDPL